MTAVTQLEADDALVAALKKYKSFTIPDPLTPCSRCMRHAAFYADPDGVRFYCGPCGPRVSLFRLPMPPDDLRQIAADLALKAKGHWLDGHEPLRGEHDDG